MANSFEHNLLVFSFAVQDWFSLALKVQEGILG